VLTQRIKKSLKGLKLLVVDEMTVSGETLKLVSKYLKTKKPKQVKYAVLYRQPWSNFSPIIAGKKLPLGPCTRGKNYAITSATRARNNIFYGSQFST